MDILRRTSAQVVAVLCLVIPLCATDDTPLLGTECLPKDIPEHCYTLHGSDIKLPGAAAIDWATAQTKCQEHGMTSLAVVDSPEIQKLVVDMVRPISSDLDQVWIAGRRRHLFSHWAYLDGSSFAGTVKAYYQNNCVKRYMDKHGLVEYREIRCTDDLNVKALCQHMAIESDCPDFYYDGMCYSQSSDTMNWFGAMSYCYRETDGKGTLAYIGLDQPEVIAWLNGTRGDKYSLELVVGIRRQPWVWITGKEEEAIKLFYWTEHSGYYGGNRCVTVVPRENGKWKDVPCAELWYYYICQNGTMPTTTTAIVTTPTTTPTLPPGVTTPVRPTTPKSIEGPTTPKIPGTDKPPSGSTPGRGTQGGSTTVPTDPGTGDGDKGGFGTKHIIAVVVGILAIIAIMGGIYAVHRCRGLPCRKTDNSEAEKTQEYHVADDPEVVIKDGHGKQNGALKQNGGPNGDIQHAVVTEIASDTPTNQPSPKTNKVNGSGIHSNGHSNGQIANFISTENGISEGEGINTNDDLEDNVISVAL